MLKRSAGFVSIETPFTGGGTINMIGASAEAVASCMAV
jgi:hypothetical protein